jgi:hypothetical protein
MCVFLGTLKAGITSEIGVKCHFGLSVWCEERQFFCKTVD